MCENAYYYSVVGLMLTSSVLDMTYAPDVRKKKTNNSVASGNRRSTVETINTYINIYIFTVRETFYREKFVLPASHVRRSRVNRIAPTTS